MNKDNVLRGYIIAPHVGTESWLEWPLDIRNISRPLEFIDRLNDVMAEIDEKFAIRKMADSSGRRTVKASHKRIPSANEVLRRRVIKFSPFPSMFSNRLKTIRRALYGRVLKTHAVIIEVEEESPVPRKIYFASARRVARILMMVKELNKEVELINKWIKEYAKSDDVELLKKLFREFNVLGFPNLQAVEIPKIWVELIPFSASFLDVDLKSMDLTDAERKVIESSLERSKEGLVMRVIEYFKNEVLSLLGSKGKQKVRIKKLNNLAEKAEELGLKGISTSIKEVIKALEEGDDDMAMRLGRDL